MLAVDDLVVSYGRGPKRVPAVNGITFRIDAGECVGFIGANGAGKSTTLKVLMGFIYADSGNAEVCGLPAGAPESRRSIGYLPEVALYYPFMKAGELLELYGALGGMARGDLRSRIPEVLKQVGLDGRQGQLLKTFSKGMQQRLGIAQALITKPDLLIMDELTSGLDPLGRYDLHEIIRGLKKDGRTIFFSSHELSEVEALCDRVILIDRGRIIREVTQAELRTVGRERSLEAFFIEQVRSGGTGDA